MKQNLLKSLLTLTLSFTLFGCSLNENSSFSSSSNSVSSSKEESLSESILSSGPRFYKLEGTKVDTAYEMGTNGKLKRVEYELNNPSPSDARMRVLLSNVSTKDEKAEIKIIKENEELTENTQTITIPAKGSEEVEIDFSIDSTRDNIQIEIYDQSGKKVDKNYRLSKGIDEIQFSKATPFDRNAPSYRLSWSSVAGAKGYQIYAENTLIANTVNTQYTIDLKPYTAYKIEIRAILKNDTLSSPSKPLYLVTEDTISSQDQRMKQWNEDRFGMMITWGGHSALAGKYVGTNVSNVTYTEANPYLAMGGGNGTYSEWIQFGAQIKNEEYKQLVENGMTAENFSAEEWIQIAKNAGMKYIIFISKHHEGLAMFHTEAEQAWSTEDFIAQRDFLKELLLAGAKEGIRVGAYYSQAIDWAQPGGIGWTPQLSAERQKNQSALKNDVLSQGFTEEIWNDSQWDLYGNPEYDDIKVYNRLVLKQIEELMDMKVTVSGKDYKIDTLWWDMGSAEYPEFNYNIMKKVLEKDTEKKIILNNRLLHRDEYTTMPFDFVTPEQSIPSAPNYRYWETCMTMNDNWGYSALDNNWKTAETLIEKLIQISSMGGNFLLNVGPDATGKFPAEAEKLLEEVGEWMSINAEGIYGTSASPFTASLPWGYATQKANQVYLHVIDSIFQNQLIVPGLLTMPTKAFVLTKQGKQEISFVKSEDYQGCILQNIPDDLSMIHQASVTIVLEFSDSVIETLPNPPKIPFIQLENQLSFTLDALNSTHVGNGPLLYESGFGVSHWDDPNDYMSWKIQITIPGTYQVKITYATGANGGLLLPSFSKDDVTISSTSVSYKQTHSTEGWVTFIESESGILTIDEKGLYTFDLKRSANGDSVSVRSVEFIFVS